MRNALIPVITLAGLQIGFLLGGAVIVEVVFSWPGVGRLVIDSINARDYPVVQAAVTLLAAILILANLAVDLLYAFLDPRIQYS
jgi:ABC-type dipeptide/oligopeptide/nickel transport system permease component